MANTNTKVTKVDTFNAIVKVLEENGLTNISIKGVDTDMVAFCNHEIELIQKKASSSSSKKKVDNSGYFEKVESALSNGAMTPTELAKAIGVDTPQKVTAILKDMGDSVVKTTKGKKVTYSLA